MSQDRLFDGPVSSLYPVGEQKVVYKQKGKVLRCDLAFLFQELCRVKDVAQHWLVCERFQRGPRTRSKCDASHFNVSMTNAAVLFRSFSATVAIMLLMDPLFESSLSSTLAASK